MNGSHTPPRTPLEADTYDSILHLLETLTTGHSSTRLQITCYETRIRDLENLNSELLKQNEELRSQLLLREPVPGSAPAPTSSPSPPSSLSPAEPIVVISDLEKAQYLQDALISEREAFATREESLTARIWGLETAVTDSLRDLLRERRAREEIEWKSRSMTNSVVLTGIGGGSPAREGGLARIKGELLRMGGELKAANEEIGRLREEIERLPFEGSTADETEAGMNMLKDGLKRIERLALAYAPLRDEMGLLDAIEVWKKQFVDVCKERRRKKKKEEKRGAG